MTTHILASLALGLFFAAAAAADAPVINFDPSKFSSYSTVRDSADSTVTVGNGGASVNLTGNAWKKYPYAYSITPNTVLSFTVNAADTGEMLAIGMDSHNLSLSPARLVQFAGTHNFSPLASR